MSEKQCAFCGKSPPEVKISREHVLPKWLGKAMKTGETRVHWQHWYDDRVESRNEKSELRSVDPFDQQVNKVCEGCNGGWMQPKVEFPVQEILEPLARLQEVSVEATLASSIALWAAKTACTRALMDQGNKCIPQEHYQYIRNNLSPPPNTAVWLFSGGDNATRMRHFRISSDNPKSEITGHITTLQFGELVMIIVGLAVNDNLLLKSINFLIEQMTAPGSIRVWPNPIAFKWPLPESILQGEIDDLTPLIHSQIVVTLSDPRRPRSPS